MKIIFGITTHRRNEWLDECIAAIKTQTSIRNYEIVVACDSQQSTEHCKAKKYKFLGGEQKGIAYNKNRVITYAETVVKDYDFLFMMDDDVFPIKHGWDKWILEGMKEFNLGHWVFMPGNHYGDPIWQYSSGGYTLNEFPRDGGCLLVVPRSTIQKVGGLNPAFYATFYGGEHSDFIRRCHRSGVSVKEKISFAGCEEWVDGHDWRVVSGREPWGGPLPPNERADLDRHIMIGLQLHAQQAGCPVYQDYKVAI